MVVDAVKDALPFSLAFYREFARNGSEGFQFEVTRRWTVPPNFYFNVITVGSGLRVADETIAKITDIFRKSVRESQPREALEIGRVETGVTAREAEDGWVNVTFYAQMAGFGSATVGGNTGSGAGCPGEGRPAHVLHHAGLVYDRPPGNRDLDNDPETVHRALAPERGRPTPGPPVTCFGGSW